jgi:hypothetical protein
MKRLLTYFSTAIVLVAVIFASCGRGSSGESKNLPSDTTGVAVITFKMLEHNFGIVKAGEKVGCIFSFTNTGDADLVLTSATASCGCTVPKYNKKPVAPGDAGAVEVAFDTSGRDGIQTKTVVVQSNAENNIVILRIIAEVKKEETTK